VNLIFRYVNNTCNAIGRTEPSREGKISAGDTPSRANGRAVLKGAKLIQLGRWETGERLVDLYLLRGFPAYDNQRIKATSYCIG
jgi:hypothetical protein